MKLKNVLLLMATSVATAAWGQAQQSDESLEARSARRVEEGRLELRVQKRLEVPAGKLTLGLDGIAVQVVQTDNLFQLINPLAPERYGSAWDSVVWDPFTGKASGLKLLSIRLGR